MTERDDRLFIDFETRWGRRTDRYLGVEVIGNDLRLDGAYLNDFEIIQLDGLEPELPGEVRHRIAVRARGEAKA